VTKLRCLWERADDPEHRIHTGDATMMLNAPIASKDIYLRHVPESQLVERAAGGDQSAFEAIMRRHNRALYRAARSIVKDDTEAEEAVQDAYLRAYHALPRFRGESSLATWLTRIAINQALERLRKRRRELASVAMHGVFDLEKHTEMADAEGTSSDTPERDLMRVQTRRLLEQKIDELPSAFRTVFVLRALEDMSVDECAACLGVPEATVRTRFFRAKRLLRKSLAEHMNLAAGDAFSFDGERCDRIVECVLARVALEPADG
jgi:RNA polymerase sigma-70 factor (ECF subfamily)